MMQKRCIITPKTCWMISIFKSRTTTNTIIIIIYMILLGDVIRLHTLRFHSYADMPQQSTQSIKINEQ